MAWSFNAILKFNAADAQKQLDAASRGFKNLQRGIKEASQSIQSVGQGLKSTALALSPLSIGAVIAGKTVADFEQQMSKVQAVLMTSKDKMGTMNTMVRQLGASTAYSATEVGGAAEVLAQAGFTMDQVMASLRGVIDTAAASDVSVADAADVVSSGIRAFGVEASEATYFADVLAMTSAKTNAKFIDLAEGLKYVQSYAKAAGMTFAETSFAVGVMSNAGVKGSLAGTALKNVLEQIATPSEKALELFGGRAGLSAAFEQTVKTADGVKKTILPFEVMMMNASKAIDTYAAKHGGSRLQAIEAMSEVFGMRGSTAFQAFLSQMGNKDITTVAEENFEAIALGAKKLNMEIPKIGDQLPTLAALKLQVVGAAGTAKEMAEIRLDNFLGQFKLLRNALGELSISPLMVHLQFLTPYLRKAVDFVRNLGDAFRMVSDHSAEGVRSLKQFYLMSSEDNPLRSAIEFAKGFMEGMEDVKAVAISTFESIRDYLRPFIGTGDEANKNLGNMVAKFIAIGAVAGPILGAMAIGLLTLSPIISAIGSGFGMMWSVMSGLGTLAIWLAGTFSLPIVTVVAAMAGAIAMLVFFRKDIMAWAMDAFDVIRNFFVKPFGEAMFELGAFILNTLTVPLRLVASMVKALISGIVGLIPESLMGAGTRDEIRKFMGAMPGIGTIDEMAGLKGEGAKSGIASASASVAATGVRTMLATQPPGANELTEGFEKVMASSSKGAAPTPVNVTVEMKGKLEASGDALNVIMSRAQVKQSEKNGRALDPAAKRQLLQNGAMAPAR